MLNLIMAISADHFVAKGPKDKMRWTSITDKRVFQLLTSVGGFLGAGRRTFDLLPALECRTIKCLSQNSFWTVNNFALSFPGSWLIGGQEVAGLGGFPALGVLEPWRTIRAGIVALAGPLDLDHLGAEIGKILGGPRPRQNARQIENADMRQRAGHGGGSFWRRLS